jgi:hypothetical protein
MLLMREPDDVRSGVESGSMSSSVACQRLFPSLPLLQLSTWEKENTHNSHYLGKRRMQSQHFMYHGVQVWQDIGVGKLFPGWIAHWELPQKFCAEAVLSGWVFTEFNESPLVSGV